MKKLFLNISVILLSTAAGAASNTDLAQEYSRRHDIGNQRREFAFLNQAILESGLTSLIQEREIVVGAAGSSVAYLRLKNGDICVLSEFAIEPLGREFSLNCLNASGLPTYQKQILIKN